MNWRDLEKWLVPNEPFFVDQVAEAFDTDNVYASAMIQDYLRAQRSKHSETVFILRREGRTRGATWTAGRRTVDARHVGQTLYEDVKTKMLRAYKPDLERLAELNPRAIPFVEAKIEQVTVNALTILAAAVDSVEPPEE